MLVFAVASLVACVPRYKPPTADQPHAIAKLRRTYEKTAGVQLRELITINGYAAVSEVVPADVTAALTDGVLIHPQPAAWEVAATFFHQDQRLVRESYMESEPYMDTESYSCGTYDSPRTCTRSVTRYKSVTKHRDVMKTVEVVDASCTASLTHATSINEEYLLQFTFQDSGVCSLTCYIQGEAGNEHCTVAHPED